MVRNDPQILSIMMMDIIFFAAIALFIFLKLRGQFGKVDEEQKRNAIKKFLKEQANTTKEQPIDKSQNRGYSDDNTENNIKTNEADLESNKILESLDNNLRKDLENVLGESKISANQFIQGANMAFEMVISAFCKDDKKTLQSLLSKDLADKFIKAIDEREKNQETLSTNIISIEKCDIKSAKIEKNTAIISINFISTQISYRTDLKGDLIDGSKEQIHAVNDVWTFSRSINSKNPNWTITSTNVNS